MRSSRVTCLLSAIGCYAMFHDHKSALYDGQFPGQKDHASSTMGCFEVRKITFFPVHEVGADARLPAVRTRISHSDKHYLKHVSSAQRRDETLQSTMTQSGLETGLPLVIVIVIVIVITNSLNRKLNIILI
jgi:hypothetical protein